MKLGSISSSYTGKNFVNHQVKPQNFKGLWGEEIETVKDETYYDSAQNVDFGTYYTFLEKEYYPFADETDKEIAKVIKENSRYYHSESTDINPSDSIHTTKVKLMPKLPVSAKEYNDYIARELLSKQEMDVEDRLKIAHLQRFLR